MENSKKSNTKKKKERVSNHVENTEPKKDQPEEEKQTVEPETKAEAAEPEASETSEEATATKKKSKFWQNFRGFFGFQEENGKESEPPEEDDESEKPDITTPEGKSMIDDFSQENIDDAVLNTLKKRNRLFKTKKPAAPEAIAVTQTSAALLDRINKAEKYNPDVNIGLTEEQVKKRKEQELVNKSNKKYSKTYWEIIKDNVLTFFNILLTLIGVALICVGRIKDCTFFAIMIVNIAIGLFQEIKSKKTVDKLRLVTAPSATVIRDGKEEKINVDDLVLEDVTVLTIGNQISADSIVKEGTLEVNESLLTGESLPIKKNPGDTVYAGSYVVSGTAKAIVSKVAEANWAISLQSKAKQFQRPKSELLRSMNAIIKAVSIIVLPIAAAMFTVNWINAGGADTYAKLSETIGSTAGVVVGMVPAGMFLLTSMALAVGVMRLTKRNTLVQDLYCFEMLARTNVLCLDKTGTLTDGTMEVSETVVLDKRVDLNAIMGSYLNSFSEANQTSLALSQRYPLNAALTPLATLPFSSSRKYSAVTFRNYGTYVLGAPEFIYKASDKNLMSAIEDRQKKGYRVVMLARTDSSFDDDGNILGQTQPLALFILTDHIRPEAYPTIQWFQNNGVEVKIISGDNPLTAAEIAKACGVNHTELAVSLEGLSLKEVADIADKYTVFGRVSPEQKAALVKALKSSGKTVSMTGDGVNDILAMKQSDCSIAMASGAEAPRNVAHLVLLDSNFASMPAVVMEGRRVVNNIQRSSSLFLMKTIFTIVLAIVFIVTGFATVSSAQLVYPFSPSDLLLMEFVGIGIPSFFLALQPNMTQIKGKFLSNTFRKAIPGALTLLITFFALFIMAQTKVFGSDAAGNLINYQSDSMKALFAICLTFCSLGMLYTLCKPFNTYRVVLLIADVVLMTAIILLFNDTVVHLTIFGKINVFPNTANIACALNKEQILTLFIFAFASPAVATLMNSIFNYRKKDYKAEDRTSSVE